jgi:hypothetical protein
MGLGFCKVKIMVSPSKKTCVSDEMLYELLQENEYSDTFDSEINMKTSSCGEQNISSDEEESVNDNSSMQNDTWAKSGAKRPRFPFTGKPGINVYLKDPSNPLEYFELFCTPEIMEVIARETNRYAKKCLENMPKPKLRSGTHHWKETNIN